MNENIVKSCRNWIYRNARPLDLARFRFHFEGGSKEEVLHALSFYQNADGGFGHALEADSMNPESSPIQTWEATEILREIGQTDTHPIIDGILKYLASGADCNGNCWFNTVESNNSYPCAPWWRHDKATENQIKYNPTPALAGFVLLHGDRESAVYQDCLRMAQAGIRCLMETEDCDEMHILACFVRLIEYGEAAGLSEELGLEVLKQEMGNRIGKVLTWDTSLWPVEYVCRPSHFIHSKDSFLALAMSVLIEEEKKFLADAQGDDGTWSINWAWDGFEEEWAIAKNWWKAHFIIMNLMFLKGME